MQASCIVALDALYQRMRQQPESSSRACNLCAGMVYPAMKAMTIQYHPEASPGPHDADICFEQFIDMMVADRKAKA